MKLHVNPGAQEYSGSLGYLSSGCPVLPVSPARQPSAVTTARFIWLVRVPPGPTVVLTPH